MVKVNVERVIFKLRSQESLRWFHNQINCLGRLFSNFLSCIPIEIKKMCRLNHVAIHHAASMQYAKNAMKSAPVVVFLNIMVIHTLNVVQNVLQIQSVHRIVHA